MTTMQILEPVHAHKQVTPENIGSTPTAETRRVWPEIESHEVLTNAHPLGVKPTGNALASEQDVSFSMGVFGRIPDALVLLLLEFLDESALINLGSTCRGLFAYAVHDQLWRDLCLREGADNLTWHGSWRASRRGQRSGLPKVDCSSLFSDALYRPFQCSQISFLPYTQHISNPIPRLTDLIAEDFNRDWTDRPFILTKPVRKWAVFQDWNEQELLVKHADTIFRAEAVDWTLANYFRYMNQTEDESPLYLFDRNFVEKMKLEVGKNGSYEPPQCFGEDLFNLLGEDRPDHRWLIVGPERSGSTFHKDPNATSAWNAVIRGSKYWLMFPNSITPPGVFVSDDQSEVTSPLSIAEWLLTFHEEARRTPGCLEGMCYAGEVLHVPSGWWHLVVNLEPAIAITQNFVPRSHLKAAVNFLKSKPDQVSGFSDDVVDPHALFIDRLQEVHPDLFESLQVSNSNKRKWEDIVSTETENDGTSGGFSFGFGEDIQ